MLQNELFAALKGRRKSLRKQGDATLGEDSDEEKKKAPSLEPKPGAKKQAKILARPKVVAEQNLYETLGSQQKDGSFRFSQEMSKVYGVEHDSLQHFMQNIISKSAAFSKSKDTSLCYGGLCAHAFIQCICKGVQTSAVTKTRLTTMVGSIKHTEEEVVHDQWADIQAEIQRRGFSEWEKRLVAFYTKSTQSNIQEISGELVSLSEKIQIFLSSAVSEEIANPIAQKFGGGGATAAEGGGTGKGQTMPFRGKYMLLQREYNPKTPASAMPMDPLTCPEFPLNCHWVQQSGRSEFLWCGASACVSAGHHSAHVKHILGAGGFGKVYLCYYRGDLAALKTFDGGDGESFLNELHVMSKLGCASPFVVALRASSIQPPNFSIVMNYMGGGTLHDVLHVRKQRLSLPQILQIAHQTAEGLAYCHSHGVMHRDVKSLNILFHNNPRPPSQTPSPIFVAALADLGVATFLKASETAGGSIRGTKFRVGTPVYMSPEVAMLNPYTHKADIFSWAVCVSEMLTGEEPYGREVEEIGWEKILDLVMKSNKRPPIPSDTHPLLRELLNSCWLDAMQATQRPSAAECIKLLEGVASAAGIDLSVDHLAPLFVGVLPQQHQQFISEAKAHLENPSLFAKPKPSEPAKKIPTNSFDNSYGPKGTFSDPKTFADAPPPVKYKADTSSQIAQAKPSEPIHIPKSSSTPTPFSSQPLNVAQSNGPLLQSQTQAPLSSLPPNLQDQNTPFQPQPQPQGYSGGSNPVAFSTPAPPQETITPVYKSPQPWVPSPPPMQPSPTAAFVPPPSDVQEYIPVLSASPPLPLPPTQSPTVARPIPLGPTSPEATALRKNARTLSSMVLQAGTSSPGSRRTDSGSAGSEGVDDQYARVKSSADRKFETRSDSATVLRSLSPPAVSPTPPSLTQAPPTSEVAALWEAVRSLQLKLEAEREEGMQWKKRVEVEICETDMLRHDILRLRERTLAAEMRAGATENVREEFDRLRILMQSQIETAAAERRALMAELDATRARVRTLEAAVASNQIVISPLSPHIPTQILPTKIAGEWRVPTHQKNAGPAWPYPP